MTTLPKPKLQNSSMKCGKRPAWTKKPEFGNSDVVTSARRSHEGVGIRPDAALDIFPRHRGCDREALARTRGISPDRRGAAAVAQVVEKNSVVAAIWHCRSGVGVGLGDCQPLDNRSAVNPRLVMADAALQRGPDVQALSAGQFWPTIITFIVKDALEIECRLHQEFPGYSRARIKIKHQPVGMLDIVHRRCPRMQFYGVHRDKADQPFDVIHPHPHAFASFPLLNTKLMHGVRDRRQLALVIERRPVRMPHQLERSPPQKMQRPATDFPPITDQFVL